MQVAHSGLGRVVVTGAGGGIGLALVGEFARRGFDVLALIRDIGKRADLDALGDAVPGRVTIDELDVRDCTRFRMPDDVAILINNAGVRFEYLPIEEIPLEEWKTYFEVNLYGAVELTRQAIPHMRAAGRGVICNINSSSLFFPVPFLAPYRATKAAMAAFSETLRAELAPFGIRVVEIFPGPVSTGITHNSILRQTAAAAEFAPYAPMAQRQRANQIAAGIPLINPDEAARRIVDDILREGGQMRHGTCPASDAGLELWRADHGGEGLIASSIDALLAPSDRAGLLADNVIGACRSDPPTIKTNR